jgi:poly(A) polymerase
MSVDIAHEVLKSFSSRLVLPKKVQYQIVKMYDGQRRFESGNKRFSKSRFVAQDSFPDTLALQHLHIEVFGGNEKSLKIWKDLHAEHLKSSASDESKGDASDRPKRRPRRRRNGYIRKRKQ